VQKLLSPLVLTVPPASVIVYRKKCSKPPARKSDTSSPGSDRVVTPAAPCSTWVTVIGVPNAVRPTRSSNGDDEPGST
jgi:hypothetical protein